MYILYCPLISPLGPYMVFWGQCYEGQGGGRRREGLLTKAKWENNSLKPSISTIADNFRDAVYNEKADIDWKKMLCIYHTLASFSLILATSLIALISQPGTSHSGVKNTKLTAHAQLGCYRSSLSEGRQVSNESKLGSFWVLKGRGKRLRRSP